MLRLMFLGIFIFSSNSFAAIPKKNIKADPIVTSLKTKPQKRLASIKKAGKDGIRRLRMTAFDKRHTVETRWKALTTLARIAKREAIPDLEVALKSSDWFMRDAGIKSLEKIDGKLAKVWARRLVADPALIVRTTAVGVLKRLQDKDSADMLWQKLYSPQNYRGSQSLWVRRHIVETLASFPRKNDADKFKKILEDKDKSLHRPALAALDKIKYL